MVGSIKAIDGKRYNGLWSLPKQIVDDGDDVRVDQIMAIVFIAFLERPVTRNLIFKFRTCYLVLLMSSLFMKGFTTETNLFFVLYPCF